MDRAHFADQLFILLGSQGLGPIGKRMIGLVMNFNDQAISANGHTRTSQRRHHIVLASSMRRINEHGKVRNTADRWDRRQVHGVSCVLSKGSNTAFAKNDLVVAL